MSEILPKWKTNKVLVSMAAGIPISFLEGFLPMGSKVIRIMPNTPAMVREGMVAVCRNNSISNQDMEIAMEIFQSVGQAEEVAESLMDCVIGLSGSSPAYTYLYIEALVEAAIANGMEKEMATRFAAQSVLGAAKMVLETGVEPKQLCLNVCSPGGTTIEAVNTLHENGFKRNVAEAFQAAVEKSKFMSKQRERQS
jgi:pyrroline-5-carboxylate reductase